MGAFFVLVPVFIGSMPWHKIALLVLNTKTPNARHQTPNTEHQTTNTKHRKANTTQQRHKSDQKNKTVFLSNEL